MQRDKSIIKKEFEKLYLIDLLSVEKISGLLNIPETTLLRWKNEWNIPNVDRIKSWVGKRFGNLVIISEETNSICVCQCDCGNIKKVKKGNLPNTKSCGCLRISNVLSMIGTKYGALTPVSIVNKKYKNKKSTCLECLCDCGKKTIVLPSALRNKETISCGCVRSPTIKSGSVFGRLVVLKKERTLEGSKSWHYKCLCDCGNITYVNGTTLKRGKTLSCGCLRDEKSRLEYGESTRNLVFYSYYKNAKKRNLEFDLTIEKAEILFKSNCYYCGSRPTIKKIPNCYGDYFCNGIDRIDNKKGYINENMVPCCTMCNLSKRTKTVDYFISWALKIVRKEIWDSSVCLLENTTFSKSEKNKISNYKRSAKDRNLIFSLDDLMCVSIFRSSCSYCKKESPSGIDRIDSSLGYIVNNVAPACKDCNFAKNNNSLESFLDWAKRLKQHQTKSNSTKYLIL